jgi:hypothetical protein
MLVVIVETVGAYSENQAEHKVLGGQNFELLSVTAGLLSET